MSDSLADASFDEEKYANDSFETEVPESSSFYGSETEFDESDVKKQLQKQQHQQQGQQPSSASFNKSKPFTRTGEFMTCESSSDDEDDVILGETIAEINTERIDFFDETDDNAERDEADGSSLTPAQRVFQMASATRRQAQATNHGFPTPPNSKESVTNEDILDDFDDDFELSDCDEFEALERATSAAEEHYRNYAELASGGEFVEYEEEEIVYGSEMRMQRVYEDGGEIDVGEPNIGEELGEEEQELDPELIDDRLSDEEVDAANSESGSISSHTEQEKSDDETDVAAGGACHAGAGDAAAAMAEQRAEGAEENHSVRADDSMESFKRRVMLSQRMRCQSEGAGDCANVRGATGRSLKSSIPVWTGCVSRASSSSRVVSGAAMLSVSKSRISVRSHASAPEFNEKSETERSEKFIDSAAGGDYTDCSDGFTDVASTFGGNTSVYEKELERFLQGGKAPKPPKKLKAGERRNKSFTNERLRDIERSNHILLRKIINQKPTVVTNEKKKKTGKFASLPPTTRLSSAEINRKKQERQIALDNQLFKKKLDAILQRKPKTKPKI